MRSPTGWSSWTAAYIVEDGPPEQVIGNPQHERTQLFLARVLNPTAVEEGDEYAAPALDAPLPHIPDDRGLDVTGQG